MIINLFSEQDFVMLLYPILRQSVANLKEEVKQRKMLIGCCKCDYFIIASVIEAKMEKGMVWVITAFNRQTFFNI